MKSVKFINKLYLIYVIGLVLYFLSMNSYLLFKNRDLTAALPWLIQTTVLTLIVLRHKWVRYGIKGWSLFFIIGSGLQVVGQFLTYISDDEETMDFDSVIGLLLKFLLGLILFAFADKSIKDIEKKDQHGEDN